MFVLGLDIDDTIVVSEGIVAAFWDYLTSRGITNYPDIYHATHSWKQAVPDDDPNRLYFEFCASGRMPLPEEMPEALSVLREIQDIYQIHLVTTRHVHTLHYITTHLQEVLFPGVRFCSIHPCSGMPKAPRLQEIGAQFHIDDSINELNSLTGIPGLTLIQFPYFSRAGCPVIDHPDIIRLKACDRVGKDPPEEVRSAAWQEIQETLLVGVDLVAASIH